MLVNNWPGCASDAISVVVVVVDVVFVVLLLLLLLLTCSGKSQVFFWRGAK